jgi:hypothetical protein
MKYVFLVLCGLSVLSAWNFGTHFGADLREFLQLRGRSDKEIEEANRFGFSLIVGLIVVSASVVAALVCLVGFLIMVRLDGIEARLP